MAEANLAAHAVQMARFGIATAGRDELHFLLVDLVLGLAVEILGVAEEKLDGRLRLVEGMVGGEVGSVDALVVVFVGTDEADVEERDDRGGGGGGSA